MLQLKNQSQPCRLYWREVLLEENSQNTNCMYNFQCFHKNILV